VLNLTKSNNLTEPLPLIPALLAATVAAMVMTAVALASPAPQGQGASNPEQDRLDRATRVFREIMDAPDQGIPRDLIDHSECVLVIPSMKKGGFIFGGRYGKGAVSCRKAQGTGPWGPPSMVTLEGGSFGLQIGAAAVDVVMLVMNPSGIDRLLQDKFTLGGDVSAAAGPVGRSASAETDAQMNAKILTYSRSQGVFAGLELKGAVLKQDRDGNQDLYKRAVSAREILLTGNVDTPVVAQPFVDELAKVSPKLSQ
jgi:SH3 domain-containing YSC84-like protein 1